MDVHRKDPFPLFKELRDEAPVAFVPEIGHWLVTRYSDIERVLQEPETFSSRDAFPTLYDFNPPEVLERLQDAYGYGDYPLMSDPPEHGPMRKASNYAFRGQRVNGSRGRMVQLAEELLENHMAADQLDLVEDYADPLVRRVLATLVGVPLEDVDQIRSWSDSFLQLVAPGVPLEQRHAAVDELLAYDKYAMQLIERLRTDPGNGMMNDLVQFRHPDGSSLSDEVLVTHFKGFWVAGVATTRDAITGAVLTLMNHRECWDALVQDSTRIPRVLEEVLRRETPHRGLARTVVRDTELGGIHLPAGSRLMLMFGSANRDEGRFDDPDAFNPERPNIKEHLALGQGVHLCSGAHLARTEGQVALEVLSRRLPSLRLVDGFEPEYWPTFWFRGVSSLPVTW